MVRALEILLTVLTGPDDRIASIRLVGDYSHPDISERMTMSAIPVLAAVAKHRDWRTGSACCTAGMQPNRWIRLDTLARPWNPGSPQLRDGGQLWTLADVCGPFPAKLKILVSPVQSRPCPLPQPRQSFGLAGFSYARRKGRIRPCAAKVQPNFEMHAGGRRRIVVDGRFEGTGGR